MLEFSVENQKVALLERKFLVEKSENYLQLKFNFSEDWNGFNKVVYFQNRNATDKGWTLA